MEFDTTAQKPQDVKDLLHVAGLRCTPSRRAVLSALLDVGHPLTHAQISSHLSGLRIDRVTLYRTLAAMVDAGLVHRVLGPDNVWRFCAHDRRPDRCPGDHGHFLCVSCDSMRCLLDQRLPWIQLPDNYRVLAKQLVAFGLCPQCAVSEV